MRGPYQGQLQNNGALANGTFNLTFTLFNVNTGGSSVAGPVTNSAVPVTNGLFTVAVDFGAGVFTGANYWLQIGVETNGGSAFVTLAPRQPLTPAPYAIYAEGVTASEEVEQAAPQLVLRDAQGEVLSVRYEQINAMLLNEFLKQHQTLQAQEKKLAAQDGEIQQLQQSLAALQAQVSKLAQAKSQLALTK